MFNIKRYHIFALLVAIFINGNMIAQGHEVRVFGYVLDTDNRGVELANVYVEENIDLEDIVQSVSEEKLPQWIKDWNK